MSPRCVWLRVRLRVKSLRWGREAVGGDVRLICKLRVDVGLAGAGRRRGKGSQEDTSRCLLSLRPGLQTSDGEDGGIRRLSRRDLGFMSIPSGARPPMEA